MAILKFHVAYISFSELSGKLVKGEIFVNKKLFQLTRISFQKYWTSLLDDEMVLFIQDGTVVLHISSKIVTNEEAKILQLPLFKQHSCIFQYNTNNWVLQIKRCYICNQHHLNNSVIRYMVKCIHCFPHQIVTGEEKRNL